MRMQSCRLLLSALMAVSIAGDLSAMQGKGDVKLTRDVKVVSSAGARALADACTAWAEQNKQDAGGHKRVVREKNGDRMPLIGRKG